MTTLLPTSMAVSLKEGRLCRPVVATRLRPVCYEGREFIASLSHKAYYFANRQRLQAKGQRNYLSNRADGHPVSQSVVKKCVRDNDWTSESVLGVSSVVRRSFAAGRQPNKILLAATAHPPHN